MPRTWGTFQILQKVGQGGFGEVYKAFDTTLQREVALKLLRPRGLDSDDETRSILREARQIAKVRHPNVLSVYGVDRHDGRVGFWSDFVQGKTLSELLAVQGPFGPREAVSIGIDLAKAISAVHAAGLLHRDIKSGNAMREVGGRILLMDFGLTQDRTETSQWGGTPAYMAPELLAGEPATVASDMYALGVLLFHLLTAKYPYAGSSFEQIKDAQQAGRRLRLLDERPDLPAPLARVVETASHADPAERYASAGALIAALSDAPEAPPRWPKWIFAPVLAVLLPAAYLGFLRERPAALTAGGAHATYAKAQDQLEHYYRPQGVEKAVKLFEQTIAEDPQFALAYAGLARANFLQYWQRGDTKFIEPALAAATKALSIDRNLASVHVTLGRLYTETGKNDLASQELNEALRLDARSAEAYHGLALLYQKQGRAAEVEPMLRKAMDLAPDDWRFPDELAEALGRSGKLDQSLDLYRQAVALSPDNARALNNLGLAYLRLAQLDEAGSTFEKAISIAPGFNSFVNLGAVQLQQGKYEPAAQSYRRAIELNSTSYIAWANLGLTHVRSQGRPQEARDAYLKAIALAEELRRTKPNDASLLSSLGLYYAFAGDSAKSETLLRQALALAPDDTDLLFRATQAYERLNRRTEALQWLDKALAKGLPLATVKRYPELAALRADPRFSPLAKRFAKQR